VFWVEGVVGDMINNIKWRKLTREDRQFQKKVEKKGEFIWGKTEPKIDKTQNTTTGKREDIDRRWGVWGK